MLHIGLQIFTLSETGLRGHEYKLKKPRVNLDIRKYFFLLEL